MRLLAAIRPLALLPYLLASCLAGPSLSASAFGLNDVVLKARKLADDAYQAPDDNALPKSLRDLSYDQFRDIRFRPERALWRADELPFEVQFFHPGFYFNHPVKINVVTSRLVTRLRFNSADFNYGHNQLDKDELKDIGYAGFRIHFPVNNSEYKDEVAVFLGASYFRALGRSQIYGLSARGLAVDTAEMSGEEFPAFTEFWLVKPKSRAREMVIYGLLNSRHVTGAYQFTLRPGPETQMDVQSVLYFRNGIGKLGIAPLTSMFNFGENQSASVEDYRPEVHDSDGLLLESGIGEWTWRPLVNPHRLLVTSFAMNNPKGFGLMQRDRDYSHYQDLESRYDRRPSVWVMPLGKWGQGRVELVQIPTPDETNDNIVAYWVPGQTSQPGQPFNLQYRLSWQWENLAQPPHAWVAQTRRGKGYFKDQDDSLRFIVDFEGPVLKKMQKTNDPIEAMVWVGDTGELKEKQVYPNPVTGGLRVSLRMRRKGDDPVEMRVWLRQQGKVVSETWSYVLPSP